MLKSKTPAEFFAEHQNIAGFDNPGKSLYTSIREFVENGLDACEAGQVLGSIKIKVEKLNTSTFNELRGIGKSERKDIGLYANTNQPIVRSTTESNLNDVLSSRDKDKKKGKGKDYAYFRVTCEDNGTGMKHENIPNMLGIVLSSTKYGVKQTRGKYGLGAKMALVWSKKSTGLPIKIWTAQEDTGFISYCKLDLDIQKNKPNVLEHNKLENPQNWRGTKISIVIGGNWKSYGSKVVNYLRQLAVITPYAEFNLIYDDLEDSKKSFEIDFARRSDRLPPPCLEVKHHPSSVDNLLVESLIYATQTKTLKEFLNKDFSSISTKLANRLISELGGNCLPNMKPSTLSKQQIHKLTQLLKAAKFAKPTAECLSPAGEYNLRLGIIKEINPDMIATFSEPPAVYEGHPFIVEAAVCIGGKDAKQGIQCHRYANRIPLLFEGGNDVVTQVATKYIRWAGYKITKTDKVGVFVSIVSTKIAFKGTSKEYIGDDKGVLHKAVKHAISMCCVQLRKRIVTNSAAKSREDRAKNLIRYIPDVTRSVMSVLSSMNQKDPGAIAVGRYAKKRRLMEAVGFHMSPSEDALALNILQQVETGEITEKLLRDKLNEHVLKTDMEDAEQYMTSMRKADRLSCDNIFATTLPQTKLNDVRPLFHPTMKYRLYLNPKCAKISENIIC